VALMSVSDNTNVHEIMQEVFAALKEAGYDPYAQIKGYLMTGEDCYITRKGDARNKIKKLDRQTISIYLKSIGM